jgi:hypothetical protein
VGGCFKNIAADFKARDFPIQPWAAALAKEREQSNRKDDPNSHCLPPSVPRINVGNHPFKILQTPGLIAMKQSLHLLADSSLIENICENEWDAAHLVGK